ncbi:hypothetical protein GGR52DRAFT_555925 [Hypoxylon sp. FL1284]|nr:hypothetical protein GGR52DRAFT_555925 [Hypoxylon sp. FL1284]
MVLGILFDNSPPFPSNIIGLQVQESQLPHGFAHHTDTSNHTARQLQAEERRLQRTASCKSEPSTARHNTYIAPDMQRPNSRPEYRRPHMNTNSPQYGPGPSGAPVVPYPEPSYFPDYSHMPGPTAGYYFGSHPYFSVPPPPPEEPAAASHPLPSQDPAVQALQSEMEKLKATYAATPEQKKDQTVETLKSEIQELKARYSVEDQKKELEARVREIERVSQQRIDDMKQREEEVKAEYNKKIYEASVEEYKAKIRADEELAKREEAERVARTEREERDRLESERKKTERAKEKEAEAESAAALEAEIRAKLEKSVKEERSRLWAERDEMQREKEYDDDRLGRVLQNFKEELKTEILGEYRNSPQFSQGQGGQAHQLRATPNGPVGSSFGPYIPPGYLPPWSLGGAQALMFPQMGLVPMMPSLQSNGYHIPTSDDHIRRNMHRRSTRRMNTRRHEHPTQSFTSPLHQPADRFDDTAPTSPHSGSGSNKVKEESEERVGRLRRREHDASLARNIDRDISSGRPSPHVPSNGAARSRHTSKDLGTQSTGDHHDDNAKKENSDTGSVLGLAIENSTKDQQDPSRTIGPVPGRSRNAESPLRLKLRTPSSQQVQTLENPAEETRLTATDYLVESFGNNSDAASSRKASSVYSTSKSVLSPRLDSSYYQTRVAAQRTSLASVRNSENSSRRSQSSSTNRTEYSDLPGRMPRVPSPPSEYWEQDDDNGTEMSSQESDAHSYMDSRIPTGFMPFIVLPLQFPGYMTPSSRMGRRKQR